MSHRPAPSEPPAPGLPTAVRELRPGLWVKDEGAAHAGYGGNKVRKLARILADARSRGATDLVTLGAAGSHHVLATALLGGAAGLPAHAILVPQPDEPHVRENLARIAEACASVSPARGDAHAGWSLAREVLRLRARGRRPYVIPVGGSSPVGTRGWVDGALELAGQVARGELPRPARLVVALGSGGTMAGLIGGLALARLDVELVGVRVAARWLAPPRRLTRLARQAAALTDDLRLPRHRVEEGWLGDGYGRWDRRVEDSRLRAADLGLQLERTYTAKAFGACLDLWSSGAGPVMFLSTVSSVEPPVPSDPLPERLRRLLTP